MIKTMNSIDSRALVTDAGNTQATAKNLGDQTYDVVKLGVLAQQEISETVGGDDPADFFKFSVTQANALYLDLSATTNTKFQILSSAGTPMGTMSAGSSSGSFKYMMNLDVGTYYLKAATADSSERASYIVKTIFAPTDIQTDSLRVDYYGSGNTIKLGVLGANGTLTQTATVFDSFGFYGQNKYDTYTFTLSADANVKFDLSALKNIGTTSLSISSENGSSVGNLLINSYGADNGSIVKQLLAGTYTIDIYGYGGDKFDSATGTSGTAPTKYELKLTSTPTNVGSADAGNTQATAKNLGDQTYDVVKLGVLTQQEISETVGGDDPADFFKFSVTQANALYLDLSATTNTKFQILSSAGTPMGTMSAGSSSGSFKYMMNLDVGTYYLKAATADSSERASYIVKTIFAPTDIQTDSLRVDYYGSGNTIKLGVLGANGTLTQTATVFDSFGFYGQNKYDTYTFTLSADANVKFDLSALKNIGTTSLSISSENGSSVGNLLINSYGADNGSIVKQLLAGTYTIDIYGYGGDKFDSATGTSGTAPTKYEIKITTGTGNLEVTGTPGNDIFNNGPGNDTINGAGGVDTVIYNGLRASATVTKTSTGHTVSGPEGVDTLISIERLQFADKTFALDIDGNAGQAYRIYQAAFDRTPDNGGLKFWIGEMDNGTSLYSVADGFVHSAEFMAMYGANPSTAQFVAKLYDNVLHRQYDQGGFDFWTGVLDRNEATKTQVLANFSESPENQAGVIGVIQNGIELLA